MIHLDNFKIKFIYMKMLITKKLNLINIVLSKIGFVFIILFFFQLNYSAQATSKHISTNSKYASIIIEENSGKVLYSRSADSSRYPASMTKVMTMYIVFEELNRGALKKSSKIKFSKRAAGQPPSKLGLKSGQTISVENAMLALVTKSANDVATAIAERISGSEINFAKRMTKTARKLGMNSTNFTNASGLHNRHQKSTARDMAKLAAAVRNDFPQYYKIFDTRSFIWNGRKYKNHNKLLDAYAGTDGIKTGYVNASGFNLMASVERKGIRLIGVIFGGKKGSTRDSHLIGLFNKTFPKAKQPKIIMAKVPTLRPSIIKIKSPTLKPKSIQLTNIINLPVKKPILLSNYKILEMNNQKNWGIQIGTYSKKANAHHIAIKARRVAKDLLQMLPAELSPIYISGNSVWRVRFNNLDENSARNTCSKLLSVNMPCIPVPSETILGFLVKEIN